MKSLGRLAFSALVAWISSGASPALAQFEGGTDASKLEMSKAVVCKRVVAYEEFVPLPNASLTSEDKLLLYYRPLHFKVSPVEKPKPGHNYRAKFSQDGRVRRKGEKTVLLKKDRILEYDPTFETRSERLYLINTFSLKGLPPGEYEYDIVLHDELEKDSTATQTLAFTIIPTPRADPALKNEEPDGPESPPGSTIKPKEKKTKASRSKP